MTDVLVLDFKRLTGVSGENIYSESLAQLLSGQGHVVSVLTVNSTPLSILSQFIFRGRKLLSQIDKFAPKSVVINTCIPHLDWRVIAALNKRAIKVIHFIHNGRWVCIDGAFFRRNGHCSICIKHSLVSDLAPLVFGCGGALGSIVSVLQRYRWIVALKTNRVKFDKTIFVASWIKHIIDKSHPSVFKDCLTINTRIGSAEPIKIIDPNGSQRHDVKADFIFVGRLESAKGVDVIYDLVNLGCSVICIGRGREENRFKELARQNTSLTLVPFVPNSEISIWMSLAHCVLIPSICTETNPTVGLEAVINGRPVIAGNHSGIRELFLEFPSAILLDEINASNIVKAYRKLNQLINPVIIKNNQVKMVEQFDSFRSSISKVFL